MIVGSGGTTSIIKCYAKGSVEASKNAAGGIIGVATNTTIEIDGCDNFATVLSGLWGSGGILGALMKTNNSTTVATIRNSCNFGTIIMPNSIVHHGAGGIIGCVYGGGQGIVQNCYNAGVLKTDAADKYGESFYGLGGVVGYIPASSTTVINSVDFGETDAETVRNIGGILGRANAAKVIDLKNCYFKNTTTTKSVGSGVSGELATGKTETEIKTQAFVNELNSNIEAGCPYEVTNDDETTTTVTIDTTGWAKWVYNEGSYPTLDTTTIWNGTAWVKQ